MQEITKEEMKMFIKSGNVGYSLPVSLHNIVHIKSIGEMKQILEEEQEDSDAPFSIFTYWDFNKKQPLFDIEMARDSGSDEIVYFLSDYSLFGMYLNVDNKIHTGMENTINFYHLTVPNTDLVKYSFNNYKKALINKDLV